MGPGEIGERDIKKLLIDIIAVIAQLEEQLTHDLGLESLNTVSAGTMRNSGNRHYGVANRYDSSDSSVRRTTHT